MNKKDQPHTYASCGNPLDCSLCLANPMRKQTLCQQCGRVESIMTFSPTLKKDEQILCVECREKTIEKDQQKCTSCYGKKYYTQLTRYGEDKYRNEKIECPRCKGTGVEPVHMPSMVLVGKPKPICELCRWIKTGSGSSKSLHTCRESCAVRLFVEGAGEFFCNNILPCKKHQEEKTEWEKDWWMPSYLEHLEHGTVPEFIKELLSKEREKAYQEGVKDGEGTKNGVKRYQMGYNDAIRECVEMIKRISVDCECDSCLSGFNKGEATKIIYSTELNKKLQDLLEKKI